MNSWFQSLLFQIRELVPLRLGELGRRADLSGAAADGLEKVLLTAFDATGEELKSAASFALGGAACTS